MEGFETLFKILFVILILVAILGMIYLLKDKMYGKLTILKDIASNMFKFS